jgi:hypothetical protein
MRPTRAVECAIAVGTAGAFGLWSLAIQRPADVVLWDAGQYYVMAGQIASGQTVSAEAPYVYRLGVPWLVAQISPGDPARGFFMLNVLCGLALAGALALWLRHGIERPAVRLALVALFAAAWHGPVRYTHFNPGYVDPAFLVLVIAGLAVAHTLQDGVTPGRIAALTALTVGGVLVRETMLLVPVSAMLATNPLPLAGARRAGGGRAVPWPVLIALGAGLAAMAFTHLVVVADTTRSFAAAVTQWIRKPPSAYLLAWFTAYGPVLAVLAFDWRTVARDLAERQHLLAFLALCAVLAFVGGSDTERFLFWALPVVYLLLGRAIERHFALVTSGAIAAALLVTQALSARIPWAIPATRVEPPPLTGDLGLGAQLYGFLDRLLVIEHFHWNLWSSFGSQPFRLLRLAMYLTVTALLVWAVSRRAREAAA